MEWVVTTGRTVEEAKDAALDQLGVDVDEAEFEVVEEPKTGLFGRLRSEAQVRARVKPTVPRPKVERRDRRRRGKPGAGDDGTEATDDDATEGAAKGRSTGRAPGGGGRPRAGGTSRRPSEAAAKPARSRPSQATDAEGTGPADDVADAPGRADAPARRSGRTGAASPAHQRSFPEEIANMTEQQTVVVDFVKGLVDAFDLEATFEASADEDEITINVSGEDLGLLIGPRGATLQSIQDLGRAVLQRHFPDDRHARLKIDVGGYRERRREALERFVASVADEVRSSGKQKALEPMSSADRKVVHDAANDIDGVRTISEGYEPSRRVVILPDGDE